MPKRSYRVTLDYEVDLSELTMESVLARHEEWLLSREAGNWPVEGTDRWLPLDERDVRDLRILQRALLEKKHVLDTWAADAIRLDLQNGLEIDQIEINWDTDSVFEPVIEALPLDQRQRYREALRRGRLADEMNELLLRMDPVLRRVKIEVAE
jgi:hypothetical protein